ncbi:MAG: endonuclease III [Ruminococcaceae bacterium]|nr:endonuclease III [Oscillospiraceae bacterium]
MTKYELGRLCAAELEKLYPDAVCSLDYSGEAWKLLIMARLSAQCTDARVNIVSKELFEKFPTLKDVAEADIHALEEAVRPCGLYKTKAKSIKEACRIIVRDFGGEVPQTLDELLSLPGVGRKIANLLLGDLFGQPNIVTDTHCIRICGRLGFYPESEKNPAKIEKILDKYIEKPLQSEFCHRIVYFGRDICTARSPKCEECPMKSFCKSYCNSKKSRI